jgi:hypothetical protein
VVGDRICPCSGLSVNNEVFVIDHTPDVADRFEPLDVQFVLGTGTSREMLARAGTERSARPRWTRRPPPPARPAETLATFAQT